MLGVRRALVESRAQLVTTARGLVRERGERIAGCATDVFATRARAAKLSAESQQLIEPLLGVIEQLDTELKGVEGQLAVLCDQEPVVSLLTTVPGVGTVIAACFVSVLDEAGRFANAHHVESYLGLVPSEHTTGGRRRLGSISKQGNSYLRSMLVQAAWLIFRGNNKTDPLWVWTAQLAKRRGKRVAVIGLARRLAGLLWAMWRDGTVYDPEHLAQQGVRGLRGAAQTLEHQKAVLEKAAKKRSVKKASKSDSQPPRGSRKTSAANAA